MTSGTPRGRWKNTKFVHRFVGPQGELINQCWCAFDRYKIFQEVDLSGALTLLGIKVVLHTDTIGGDKVVQKTAFIDGAGHLLRKGLGESQKKK